MSAPKDLIRIGTYPVTVPSDFMGMNTQDYPPTTVPTRSGPAPTFEYGSVTTIDYRGCHRNVLHTGPGVFAPANMDGLIATCSGKTVNFVDIGTPAYQAQGYVDGNGGDTGDAAYTGPYGYKGEMSFTTDLTQIDAFYDWFMGRYNPVGSPPQVPVIQLGNEPSVSGTYPGRGANFWWGTAAQLVTQNARAYQRIKLRNPAVIVLTPGLYDNAGSPDGTDQYLDAQDPNTGLYGYQCCDAIALHDYHAYPNQAYGGPDCYDYQAGGLAWAEKKFASRGRPNLKKYITEYGIGSSVDNRVTQFLADTANNRFLFLFRLLANHAMRGVQQVHPFSLNNASQLCGDMVNDTNGVIKAITYGHRYLAGKTLTDGGYSPSDKSCWFQYASGSSMQV